MWLINWRKVSLSCTFSLFLTRDWDISFGSFSASNERLWPPPPLLPLGCWSLQPEESTKSASEEYSTSGFFFFFVFFLVLFSFRRSTQKGKLSEEENWRRRTRRTRRGLTESSETAALMECQECHIVPLFSVWKQFFFCGNTLNISFVSLVSISENIFSFQKFSFLTVATSWMMKIDVGWNCLNFSEKLLLIIISNKCSYVVE